MKKKVCAICKIEKIDSECTPFDLVGLPLSSYIERLHPSFNKNSFICNKDLQKLRALHFRESMIEDLGEIKKLEEEVLTSLKEHELISINLSQREMLNSTYADILSDKVASFGGSWKFIIIFVLTIFTWMILNSVAFFNVSFDEYPFIFLNLVLSCIAAVQAPVIMMSQNRQEAKDRECAEHDYKINLKAELEIRHLKAKLDQLASHQWRRLIEIEETQEEILAELRKEK